MPDIQTDILGEIPEVIIRGLKQLFPIRTPELSQSDREIWVEVGRQKIIKYLSDVRESQLKRKEVLPDVLNRKNT